MSRADGAPVTFSSARASCPDSTPPAPMSVNPASDPAVLDSSTTASVDTPPPAEPGPLPLSRAWLLDMAARLDAQGLHDDAERVVSIVSR